MSDIFSTGTWSGEVSLINPLATDWPLGQAQSLQRWAAAEAAALGDAPVLAVIGHCSNTTIAVQLCRALTDRGCAVGRLVVFAPVCVDRSFVADQAVRLMTGLSCPPHEAEHVVTEQFAGASQLVGPLGRIVARLNRLTRENAKQAGLDPDEAEVFADELGDRYQRWLGFLASQVEYPTIDPGAPVDVFSPDPDAAVRTLTIGATGFHVRGHYCADPFDFRNSVVQRQLFDLLATVSLRASVASV